jgi:transcriptional regulator with XRE-family HTH domain|tara:strand:+ start:197 stop:784 length:588 start_codon:yes stop_codon:yes gene_type:complete
MIDTGDWPVAVKNLRKIYARRKAELRFTQVEAAAKIGFSQGAISQYLNNITKLGPQTTIRFANFLDVDPKEIDPSIVDYLPNTKTITCSLISSDGSKSIDKKLLGQRKVSSTLNMELVGDISVEGVIGISPVRKLEGFFEQAYAQLVPLESNPQCRLVVVQLKTETPIRIYLAEEKPPSKDIKHIWAVHSVVYLT